MNVIIGNAWPYANGPLHLGRIAVLMPGDVLARYHRLMGDDVVFISGSDSHGTLVDNKAKEEGQAPEETAEKYHNELVKCFNKLNFSFDLFTRTHTEYHMKKVQEFILDLYNKGYIYEKEIEQTCSSDFDELIDTRSRYCEGKAQMKKSKHLFFALSKFENDVTRLFIKQQGWRENAYAITKRYLDEGLRDRAVTRDFHWGVDVPLKGYEDKKIYVWIEAVLGYLTASMKCLEERGEDYREYWGGDDSRVYFVHGKDNIPFHTVILPGLLAGLGIKHPNIREVSSEYLKLEGKQFSTTKNWAIWVDHVTENYNVDSLRYYLIMNGPEKKDSDFRWREFISVNNNDLAGQYGNFVNRTLTFIKKNFDGKIPKGKMSKDMKDKLFDLYFDVGDLIEEGRFKEGLSKIITLVKYSNKYFDNEMPWKTIESNKSKCADTLYTCVQLIINFSNLFEPFMPGSSDKIKKSFGIEKSDWRYIEKASGRIENLEVLFTKVDKSNIHLEINKLKMEYKQ